MIYADNAATTKLDLAAFEAMQPYLLNEYGNASQPYSFSRTAKKALKESREIIAECIGAEPEEIFFTSGGTESNNWAIKGCAFADADMRAMITSEIEHHAILNPCADIERLGYPVAYLPVSSTGKIKEELFKEYITDKTRLVSIMLINNEIGTIQDISSMAKIAHSHGALFHTDAVQAVGHIHIDVKALNVDMLSASAHKFNGPKGIGFLYIRKGTKIFPYSSGGAQELGMRAGTENIASIVGMATALKNNCDSIDENSQKIKSVSDVFLSHLSVPYTLNGSEAKFAGINSVSFDNKNGESILHLLDLKGICVSTGSACDSVNTQISHVLRSIGLSDSLSLGTIRVSFGKENTIDDAITIANAINQIITK